MSDASSAKRLGISVDEYKARRDAGEKWCLGCRKWHDTSEFGMDRTTSDGLNAVCRELRNQRRRATYVRAVTI